MPDETTSFEPGAAMARLLVVDDEENIVLTISEVLRLEGYEVDVALSGREAVRLLDEGRDYDLVLTDLHMEEGDGLSLLEEVRRRSPLTISIVLTGFAARANVLGRMEVFAVNRTNNHVQRISQVTPSDSLHWTDWEDFGGAFEPADDGRGKGHGRCLERQRR